MTSNSQPFVARTVVGLAGWQGVGLRHVYVVRFRGAPDAEAGTGVT